MQEDPEIIAIANAYADKLIKSLTERLGRIQDKYEYYNADNETKDYGISIPKKMINNRPGVGWAGRAVNTLADRVVFEGFAGDEFGINEYWDDIRAGQVINKVKNDTFIGGCGFVGIGDGPDGRKVLVPFTAMEATGIVDQNTGLLRVGLGITKWQYDKPKRQWGPLNYVVFTPEFTAVFQDRRLCDIVPNPTGRCLLHPLTRRASADRPLGKSRITNTVRRIVGELGRLKRRYEIAGEFYSTPQRYLLGLAQGTKKDPSMDSEIGKVWAITKDDDGEKPEAGQLPQMSISQFAEAKKDLARDFCAETGLTLRNLGYETGNPSSAESLVAMSDDLLLEAQTSQDEMGEQIKQIAITLRMALDDNSVVPSNLKKLTPAWKPIFQINIGAAGDAMFKLYEAMPELKGTVTSYRMLGIGIREAEQLAAIRAKQANAAFMGGGGGGIQ